MKNQVRILLGVISFIALSCNPSECKNANPIFDDQTPDTKQYQEELAKTLEADTTSQTVFTLDRYEEKDGIPYLYMHVQRQNLCATAVVLVLTSDDKLKNIQKVKGEGYSGAEFKNLKYKIFRDEAKTVLLYQGVEEIVD